MKRITLVFFYFFLCIAILNISCQKDDDLIPESSGSTTTYKVAGRVVDASGAGITGATVSSNGKTAITGNFGQFSFTGLTASNNRLIIKCEHDGYFTASGTEIPAASGITYINLTLQDFSSLTSVDAGTGGTATAPGGSSVDIPANAIIDENGNTFTGTVSVAVAHLDPTTEEFGELIQGGDMQAEDENGDDVTLYSYGILRVEMEDASGNELQLASGQNATITIPIPASMLASAPATIPLWYFDETAGIWREEGQATKTGNAYVGTVQHFTDWNCDFPSPGNATLTGRIVDCDDLPVPNLYVRTGQSYTFTDENGVFSRLVPSGVAMTCQVEASPNNGIASDPVNIAALSSGQIFNTGDISLTTCPTYLVGTISDCDNHRTAAWVKSNNGLDYNYVYTSNGDFRVRVLTSQTVTITAYTDNGAFASGSMTTSADPSEINYIDTIQICVANPVSVGQNSFTIDGDGYSNQNIILQVSDHTFLPGTFDDQEYAVSIYKDFSTPETTDDHITGKALGLNNLIAPSYPYANIAINIKATGTGTYNLITGVDTNFVYLSVEDSSTSYTTTDYKTYLPLSGTVTITRFDEPGGLVEGTFEGTFRNYYPIADVTVTNGRFSMVRLSDNISPKIAATSFKKKK